MTSIFGIQESTKFARALADDAGIKVRQHVDNLNPVSDKTGTIHLGIPSIYNHQEYMASLHREISKQRKDMKFFFDVPVGEKDSVIGVARDLIQAQRTEYADHGSYEGRDRILKDEYQRKVTEAGGVTEITKKLAEVNPVLGALFHCGNELRNEWQGYMHGDVPPELEDEVKRIMPICEKEWLSLETQDDLRDMIGKLVEPPQDNQGDGDGNDGEGDEESDDDTGEGQSESDDGSGETEPEDSGDDGDAEGEGEDDEDGPLEPGDGEDDSDDSNEASDEDGDEGSDGEEGSEGDEGAEEDDGGDGEEGDGEEGDGDNSGPGDEDGPSGENSDSDDGEGEETPSEAGEADDDNEGAETTDETAGGVGATDAWEYLENIGLTTAPVEDIKDAPVVEDVPYLPDNRLKEHDVTTWPMQDEALRRGDIARTLGTLTLSRKVKKYLTAISQTGYEYGKKRGKICAKNISRCYSGAKQPKIFKQKMVSKMEMDTAMFFLGDISGSMSGTKYATSASAQVALSEVMQAIHIPHMMMQFSTGEGGRTHFIMKRFEERHVSRDSLLDRYGHNRLYMGCNADGEAVTAAAQLLAKRPEKNKVLVVLSDGQPAYGMGDSQFLKDTVRSIEESSFMTIIGIGIQSSCVEDYYKNCRVINKLDELEPVLLGILKDTILQGRQ